MTLPKQHIQDDDESDSLMKVDVIFKCPKCGGNIVYRGTKTCYNCQNDGGNALNDMLAGFKAGGVKKVKTNPRDIAASQTKPQGNLPKLK